MIMMPDSAACEHVILVYDFNFKTHNMGFRQKKPLPQFISLDWYTF